MTAEANPDGGALLDNLTLRPAHSADQASCADIFVAARAHANPHVPRNRFTPDDYIYATEGLAVWLAELDGQPVGFVAFDCQRQVVDYLFVHPDHQRRGIGRALLQFSVEQLAEDGHLECRLTNETAIRFYSAQGCHAVGRHEGLIVFALPRPARCAA